MIRRINATNIGHREINERIRSDSGDVLLEGCLGQGFIGAGMNGLHIDIHGVPGNTLGGYLNGAQITVHGNAQDNVGDTMNDGKIVVHGNIGDAPGYAMRGGEIYVRDNAGYRAGIHMKEYRDKCPVMVIGGKAGSFLGEYQAGGIIIVLGLTKGDAPIIGNFPCTGMHGGKVFIRSDCSDIDFSNTVHALPATAEDIKGIEPFLKEYCDLFACDLGHIENSPFTVVVPNSKNPYKQMYVGN
ncbi:MAG: hypothetical protein IKE61_00815 [Coriobacteriales bacterium]|nr:hypothetical protein [Coriobacteriales bacterium]